MKVDEKAPAWWLEEGEEACVNCEQPYHLEALVHCIGCDGPVCNHCAVTVTRMHGIYCPACNGKDKKTTGDQ